MRIDLTSLENSAGSFAYSYGPEELVLNDERLKILEPPQVHGRLVLKDQEVVLTGDVAAVLEVDCDRCLKAVSLPVETSFDLKYLTGQEYRTLNTAELKEEDLSVAVFDGEVIDIDEVVREQLLLSVPTHVLCDQACKGLCSVCGADRNSVICNCEQAEVDPRWAPLKGLLNGK